MILIPRTGIDKEKICEERCEMSWRNGFLAEALAKVLRPATKVVSSLVFHQTPSAEKLRILKNMYELLVPGGQLHIADYGLQRSKLMRLLFRCTVQAVDGVEDTQSNAEGVLPELIRTAGFTNVRATCAISAITGSISFYRATRPKISGL